jgi:hypothetical protein
MRRVAIIVVAAVVTGLVVGVVLAGSNDGSSDGRVTTPELTVPGDSAPTETQTTPRDEQGATGDTGTGGAAPEQQAPDNPSGGAQAPRQDSPQNDTPPPKGSPAERFEQFCQENPGACER